MQTQVTVTIAIMTYISVQAPQTVHVSWVLMFTITSRIVPSALIHATHVDMIQQMEYSVILVLILIWTLLRDALRAKIFGIWQKVKTNAFLALVDALDAITMKLQLMIFQFVALVQIQTVT